MRLLLVGDLSLKSNVSIKVDMDDDVIVVANLEGPITARGADPDHPLEAKAGPRIRNDPAAVRALAPSGARWIMSLANNHIMDQGKEGLDSTLRQLGQSQISAVGAGHDAESARRALILQDGDTEVAVIAAAEHGFGGVKHNASGFAAIGPWLFGDVNQHKEDGRKVVVLLHLGVEDQTLPHQEDVELCRALVDVGADVVWVTHSHVPLTVFGHGNGVIGMGAGNFVVSSGSWGQRTHYELRSIGLLLDMRTLKHDLVHFECCADDNQISVITVTPDAEWLEREEILLDLIDGQSTHLLPLVNEIMADHYYQIYFQRAFLLGAFLNLANLIVAKLPWIRSTSFARRIRYPLSIDNLAWGPNRRTILAGMRDRELGERSPENSQQRAEALRLWQRLRLG